MIISILVCQFTGFIGSLFTAPSIPAWYAALSKPAFNPPNSIFAPVWIILYILMGISAYLIWREKVCDRNVRMALIIFTFQLLLNALWSFLFFGLHSPSSAFFEINILWLTILVTIFSFMKISKPAGILLLPYLLWVGFASILNLFIWKLNP